jgi:hypothetical protein
MMRLDHLLLLLLLLLCLVQVVAVYKDDGERGHHMGDYIPKEELAKFMAQCGNTQLQQQVSHQQQGRAGQAGAPLQRVVRVVVGCLKGDQCNGKQLKHEC